MGNVIEIKLEKRLPNLTPEEEQIFTEAIMEAYRRGYDDATRKLLAAGDCNDCGQVRTCEHKPRLGRMTRINCPLWRPKR